jgi:hypothetical protein
MPLHRLHRAESAGAPLKRGGNLSRGTPLRNHRDPKPKGARAALDEALAELRGKAAAVGDPDGPAAVALAAPLVLPAPADDLDLLVPGFPRAQRIAAPTYLKLVRMMPCSLPDCPSRSAYNRYPPHRPWHEAIQLNTAQCDPNHHPSRGASGGGSDLETHPVCRPCHERVTLHKVPRELLDRLVADTLLQVVRALRAGRLPLELLAQVAAEALAG